MNAVETEHPSSDYPDDYRWRLFVLCFAFCLTLATAFIERFGIDSRTFGMPFAIMEVSSGLDLIDETSFSLGGLFANVAFYWGTVHCTVVIWSKNPCRWYQGPVSAYAVAGSLVQEWVHVGNINTSLDNLILHGVYHATAVLNEGVVTVVVMFMPSAQFVHQIWIYASVIIFAILIDILGNCVCSKGYLQRFVRIIASALDNSGETQCDN